MHWGRAERHILPLRSLHSRLREAALSKGFLEHDSKGIMLHLNPRSDVLLVSCSGFLNRRTLRGLIGNRVIYAMENTTRCLGTSKLFICDPFNLWYYGGIAGLSRSFDETVDLIGSLIEDISPRICCAIGTSAGGYMALVLAAKLRLNRALALSPQTILSADGRSVIGDDRWSRQMLRVNRKNVPYDVRELCLSCNNDTHFHIIYGREDLLDSRHALRLRDLPNVSLHSMPIHDHNVSHAMRKFGFLQDCIEMFVRQDDANAFNKDISQMFQSFLPSTSS